MKVISLNSSEGNKTSRYKFKRMNGRTEANHYHHSDMAPISVMSQRNFGIWYMILPSADTPAMFIDKKYLIQQLIIDNFRRVPDKNEIGAGRIVNYSQTLVVSLYISAVSHRVERVKVTLLQHPSSLDSNEVQGFSAWSHEVDQRGHVWTWSDKIPKFISGRTSLTDARNSRTAIIKCE